MSRMNVYLDLQQCLSRFADHLNNATDAVDDLNGEFTAENFYRLMELYRPLEDEDMRMSHLLQGALKALPEEVSIELHTFLAAFWAKFQATNIAFHVLAAGVLTLLKNQPTPEQDAGN